ncbi:MAG TPA: hypothetical protein VJJ82_04840 [Candidatus Nanoarchaeia archaeon]|nr:hypothetical protein [Candidatus Nanoarchaeia archaeon]
MKKGQVTVFIILGIVIVVVFGLLWHGTTTAPSLSVDNTAITDHVSSCLSTVATRGVYKLAAQGGYINPKGDIAYGEEGDAFPAHYYLGAHALSYVLDGNASSMRRLPAMTAALSRYIAVELSSCLNFTELELQGYTVNAPSIDWEAINFDFPQASVPYSPQPLRFSIIPRADSQDIAVVANYPI